MRLSRKVRVQSSVAAMAMVVTTVLPLMSSCGDFGKGDRRDGKESLPPDWQSFQGHDGLSLTHPKAWRVSRGFAAGLYELQGNQGEYLGIWPLFAPHELDKAQLVEATKTVSGRMCRQSEWRQVTDRNESAIKFEGQCNRQDATMIMTWTKSAGFTSMFAIVASAPRSQYPAAVQTFDLILRSVKVQGAPSSAQAAEATVYTSWQDPYEHAFTIDAPKGWVIEGGLYRFAPIDTRKAWLVKSPDGLIQVQGGDASIPYFTTPISGFESQYPEGSYYPGSSSSAPHQPQMMVMRFKEADQWIADYVPKRFSKLCQNITLERPTIQRHLAEEISRIYQSEASSVNTAFSEADGSFSCEQNGTRMRGYILVGTVMIAAAGPATWMVDHIFSYLAPAVRESEARGVLSHMMEHFQPNPEWEAMQSRIASTSSRIYAETQTGVSKVIKDSFEQKNRSMDELSQRRSNAILGLVDVVDTQTGRAFKIESNADYYWIDHQGRVVGTQVHWQPSANFRPLLMRP